MSAPTLALTRDEAAEAARVSKDRIDKAIRSGALKAKQMGRRIVIRVTDLEAWLDSQPDV